MSSTVCSRCGARSSAFNIRCVACGATLSDGSGVEGTDTVDLSAEAGPEGGAQPGAGLRPGATFGRFVVLDRLGEGAMGLVIAAVDPALDRKVAIKILRRGVLGAGGDERARARLV